MNKSAPASTNAPSPTIIAIGQHPCSAEAWPCTPSRLVPRPGPRIAPACAGLAAAVVGLAIVAGPQPALAQRPLGLDVSSYQGSGVDWTSVKNSGRVFAWAKATEGTGYTDGTFAGNQTRGKAAGVYMGAYHYAHPELNTPAAEASHFWSVAGGYMAADGLTLMPMLDIEGSAFNGNVGASSLSDWINQWCTDVVQDAANNGVNIKPSIYISACNASHLNSTVGVIKSG